MILHHSLSLVLAHTPPHPPPPPGPILWVFFSKGSHPLSSITLLSSDRPDLTLIQIEFDEILARSLLRNAWEAHLSLPAIALHLGRKEGWEGGWEPVILELSEDKPNSNQRAPGKVPKTGERLHRVPSFTSQTPRSPSGERNEKHSQSRLICTNKGPTTAL